jgi:DNA polymerase III subunit delta
MQHLQIIRDIEMKKTKPVYMLMGEEPYFIDLIVDYIEDKVLDEASKAFCQTVVYGRDVSMDQVLSLAKGFPMMGDQQIVIVKEAQDMRDWKKQDDLKGFEAYLANPTPSTLLVFSYKHKTLDKRTKVYKQLEKVGVVFNSEKVKDYKLSDWIESYVKSRGFTITAQSAQLLSEYLGTDLSKVVNEINKLSIILPAGSTITEKHIEENIGISKDYNVFELQKALNMKDVLKANRIINYFESNPKANPIQMVLPSLYSHFTKLAMFISLKDKKEAAKELGVNPYFINDYRDAATRFSAMKVERIISYIREADKRAKGVDNVSIEDGDIMKELVFKILH